ncbi:unnamed protein product, partial [Oncorhynchus mykiss]
KLTSPQIRISPTLTSRPFWPRTTAQKVDVWTKEEVDRGHIPGSIHIPVDTVESALVLDPAEFQTKYGVPNPPLDAPELVFHCQMGRRGGVATDKARGLGFQKSVNYAGGYQEWSERGEMRCTISLHCETRG